MIYASTAANAELIFVNILLLITQIQKKSLYPIEKYMNRGAPSPKKLEFLVSYLCVNFK